MTVHISVVQEIKARIARGDKIKAIANDTGVTERTIRRWRKDGFPGDDNAKAGKETANTNDAVGGNLTTNDDAAEVSVADLVKAGFRRDRAPIVVASIGIAQRQGNKRLALYIHGYVMLKREHPETPEGWCALIAGFPILAADIQAPSLAEVANLARRYSPYISKEARKLYQKEVNPVLVKVLAEVQTFLQNAAEAGGFPIALTATPPPGKYDWGKGVSFRVEDSLEQGCLTYIVPSSLSELSRTLPVERTWAVILFDIISRLPNPDRQKGKAWKDWQLTALLYKWVSTAPHDFAPPLPDIGRKTADEMPHTLAKAYSDWTRNEQNPELQEGKDNAK